MERLYILTSTQFPCLVPMLLQSIFLLVLHESWPRAYIGAFPPPSLYGVTYSFPSMSYSALQPPHIMQLVLFSQKMSSLLSFIQCAANGTRGSQYFSSGQDASFPAQDPENVSRLSINYHIWKPCSFLPIGASKHKIPFPFSSPNTFSFTTH